MTLLFMDGFDFYTKDDVPGRYDGVVNVEPMVTPGRAGIEFTQACRLWRQGYITKIVGGKDKLIAGVGAKQEYQDSTWNPMMQFISGATVQVTIAVDGLTGAIVVYRGTSQEIGRCDSPVRAPYWFHLAAEATFDEGGGSVRVAINGAILLTLTGEYTDPAGTGTADRVRVHSAQAGSTFCQLDDFYVADGSGAVNNELEDFGDLWVGTHYPESDDSVDWTPKTGSSNYEMVDEKQEDGDTTYNHSATPTATDIFGCPDIEAPDDDTVLGVQVSAVVKKYSDNSGGGSREFVLLLKSGAAEPDPGAEVAPGCSCQVFSHLWPVDPDGDAPWTVETAELAKIGIRVTA